MNSARSQKSAQQKEIGNYIYWENCLLGKGATGNVYRGKRKNETNLKAVKIIDQRKITSEVLSYLLKNEVNACKLLSDPNVLKTYDVLRQNGYCYIFMELYSGGSLRDHIKRRGKLSEVQSLNLFEKILNGYSSIMKAKILHRDLKTDNILLTENGEPVIIDLGYCQFIDSQQKPKMQYNVGSPGYMPPEAYNKNIYSQKSDVWSLGVILHQMLTGNILKMHTRSPDKYFKDLQMMKYPNIQLTYENEVIMHLLLKCLSVNRYERGTVLELREMIQNWKEKKGIISPKEEPQGRKKIKSLYNTSSPIKQPPKQQIPKKDESIYATQNVESPVRKVTKKGGEFGKLKRKIINKEGNQSFSIKPISILPIETNNVSNTNRPISPMPSPVHQEAVSVTFSPTKNPESQSPLYSPTMSPGFPRFCRKSSTSSTNNLKIKLRMI